MIRPGKTVISDMLGANNKTASWVEVLAMWGHESECGAILQKIKNSLLKNEA